MVHLARADSFVGRIQRGLGSGYLAALERPADMVASAVLGCIATDPRLNDQDEERALYYARLIVARGIDDALIAQILTDAPEQYLALEVLGVLARTGRPSAIAALRDYVAWGSQWRSAIDYLADTSEEANWSGLDHVLIARFANESEARDELGYEWRDREPWRSWSERGPLARLRADFPPPRAIPDTDLTSWSTQELLARPSARNELADVVANRIRDRVGPDWELVSAALMSDDPRRSAPAIHVLGRLGDPAIVGPAAAAIHRIGPGPNGLYPSILRGMQGLGPGPSIDIARAWREAHDFREVIALSLLATHATDDDLPWVLDRIRWAARTHRDLYGYARILRRFPGRGPFEGFERIYRRYVPTCCRGELVIGMSIADPTFGSTLAFECLFDCESRTRTAAAGTVDLAVDGARDRLEVLSRDELEDPGVREAALTSLRERGSVA